MLQLAPLGVNFTFFFNDTATTEIYTLSLHDALPISRQDLARRGIDRREALPRLRWHPLQAGERSEEHTSELQSQFHLVCRLLLEKKKSRDHTMRLPRTTSRPQPLPPLTPTRQTTAYA